MSLNIYTKKSDIPASLEIVKYNDTFFNMGVPLKNNEITRKILSDIDKAEYHSPTMFIGRDPELGALNKENLSTGCKTLLNIVYHPEVCIDVVECGNNALSMFPYITAGNILWEIPVVHYIGEKDNCDINIDGNHFSSFEKFTAYIMN